MGWHRCSQPLPGKWRECHRIERDYVTAELIRDTSFTATEAELKQRIGDLRDAGYTQFAVQLTPGNEDAIEDWARIARAFQ